jgi:hypothetical protein
VFFSVVPKGNANEFHESLALLSCFALIDYYQSYDAFYNKTGYYEINPLLGNQPSQLDMLVFGAAGISALFLAGKFLPEFWSQILIDSALASELWNIEDNARLMEGQKRRTESIMIIISVRF